MTEISLKGGFKGPSFANFRAPRMLATEKKKHAQRVKTDFDSLRLAGGGHCQTLNARNIAEVRSKQYKYLFGQQIR